MAGVWARSDATAACTRRPPTRSCAASPRSRRRSRESEQDLLNPDGHQRHPRLPGRRHPRLGRAHAVERSAWRYVNVRRLFNYIEESIADGTQWVVFEPNDPTCGSASRAPSAPSCAGLARRRALRRRRPRRRSSSSATPRPTRPRSSTPGRSIVEIGIAPGQAGRVRRLPALAVLRRVRPRRVMTTHHPPFRLSQG